MCICPSISPSVCLFRCFLEIESLVFSNFGNCVRNPYEVVCNSWIFWKISLAPDMAQNGLKIGVFFRLMENSVVIFFWICFFMKFYNICSIPEQIPYMEKCDSWDCWGIGINALGELDCRIFKSHLPGQGLRNFFGMPYKIVHGVVRYMYDFLVSITILICNKTAKITLIHSFIP